MFSSTNLLSLFILCLIFVHYIVTKWSRRKKGVAEPRCSVPLAPRGHWLLGHAALPSSMLGPTLTAWKDTHGPVLDFFIIPKLAPLGIVISDVELIRGGIVLLLLLLWVLLLSLMLLLLLPRFCCCFFRHQRRGINQKL